MYATRNLYLEESMNSVSNGLMRLAVVLAAATAPLLAGATTVTPEPSMVLLTAVGAGAVVLIARRKRGR